MKHDYCTVINTSQFVGREVSLFVEIYLYRLWPPNTGFSVAKWMSVNEVTIMDALMTCKPLWNKILYCDILGLDGVSIVT
jgi:hypothetical protein